MQKKHYVKVCGVNIPVEQDPRSRYEENSIPRIDIPEKFRGRNKCPTLPGIPGPLFLDNPKKETTIPRSAPTPSMCPQCGRIIDRDKSLCDIALRGHPCWSPIYKDVPK